MSTERHYSWMWLHAMEVADQAERLHRRFLRYLGPGTSDALGWEPPVDIHERPDGLVLVFALPGVAPEDIEIHLEADALTVTAQRRLNLTGRDTFIRRLEIPHGRFVRQIALAGSGLTLKERRCVNGCLELRLARAEGVE